MYSPYLSLTVFAIPSIVGSYLILYIAGVGDVVWITHSAAICFACLLVLAGKYLSKYVNQQIASFTIIILTCIGLVSTLLGDSLEPERWVSIGPFKLYVAAILLPSFFAACSTLVRNGDKNQIVSFTSILCVAILLTLQPDASQVLGLLIATAVIAIRYRLSSLRLGIIFISLLLATMWAFSKPDPLDPVPHVEEVFKIALDYSLFAGVAVIAAASALIVGLWIKSMNGPLWLSAVAAYYASLFACSIAGLTPAPLVGYGAGPILGFGLMLGCLRCLEPQLMPNKPIQPTANSSVD